MGYVYGMIAAFIVYFFMKEVHKDKARQDKFDKDLQDMFEQVRAKKKAKRGD